MAEILITTREELKAIIMETLVEFSQIGKIEKVYNINQVAKMTGKAHATITKYVSLGIIKSTTSGQITEGAINQWLNIKEKKTVNELINNSKFPISQ
jgi:hypothetical protein